MRTVDKDPKAVLDYDFDWSKWLSAGESITGTPVFTVPVDLTVTSQTNTASVAKVWLSGGVLGETYTIECEITTDQGRTDERSLGIRIIER